VPLLDLQNTIGWGGSNRATRLGLILARLALFSRKTAGKKREIAQLFPV
jgi:hypothetical protein